MTAKPKRCPIIYDGDCGFCTVAVRQLEKLDWLARLESIPAQQLPLRHPELAKRFAPNDLLEAIHGVTSDGRLVRGAACVRWASWQLPLGWPLAMVLWVMSCLRVDEMSYQWVARNRHRISGWLGIPATCGLPKTKPREDSSATAGKTSSQKEAD